MASLRTHGFHLLNPTIAHRPLYVVALMLLFWALADGLGAYLLPIYITQSGFSATAMGLIIGSSAVTGCVFDLFLSKYLKSTHFRRIYLVMLLTALLYPLMLFEAKTVWAFLAAMAVWGIYYDLSNFGNLDFISRKLPPKEHAHGFGILWIFRMLGFTLSPIIAGAVIVATVGWQPFALMGTFIIMAILCFIVLTHFTLKNQYKHEYIKDLPLKTGSTWLGEIGIWRKISRLIFPILIASLLISIFDSFFWTAGPLVAETLTISHPFNGLFLALYTIPTLLLGGFVGKVCQRYGKKKTAYFSFLMGTAVLSSLLFIRDPWVILAMVFVSSMFTAFTWPSLNAIYADFITESPHLEKELESLQDFSTNLGFFIGPVIAGFMIDRVGYIPSFAYLSIFIALVVIVLLAVTPKSISIRVHLPEPKPLQNPARETVDVNSA